MSTETTNYRGYLKIKKEIFQIKFNVIRPIEEQEIGNYAMIINGNLYLSLGANYIMFHFEKEIENTTNKYYPDKKYYTDIWDKILATDKLNVSYNPSYERLEDGIINFKIYISLDEWSHYELSLAMDRYCNPTDFH
jgi:hypothetical protein